MLTCDKGSGALTRCHCDEDVALSAGITRMTRIRNDDIRRSLGIVFIQLKVRENHLAQLHSACLRRIRCEESTASSSLVQGRRGSGRLRQR